jgi:DNA modification methylase
MNINVKIGDAREVLKNLPEKSIHCCVTSPPYYNLRSYCDEDSPEKEKEIGTEQTPQEYVDNMVDVCREIKRVLRDDGILWINIGDSFYNYRPGKGQALTKQTFASTDQDLPQMCPRRGNRLEGLKEKDLIGIPWAVSFALRDDGWFLRRDIIWNKLNNMPESVNDRATTSHEYIFMFTKKSKYFYDSEAVKEPAEYDGRKDTVMKGSEKYSEPAVPGKKEHSMAVNGAERWQRNEDGEYLRNLRSVWSVPTESYTDAHFASFSTKLIDPCLRAGTSERGCCPTCGAPWERIVEKRRMTRCELPQDDIRYRPNTYHGAYEDINGRGDAGYTISKTIGWQPTCNCYSVELVEKPNKDDSDEVKAVREKQLNTFKELSSIPCTALDPFAGTGTVGRWCVENGRSVVLIELNPKYKPLIERRLMCNKEVMLIKSDDGDNINFETSTLDDWL